MAGHNYIRPEFIDMEFWSKMPLKLSAVKFYDKSLVNMVTIKKIVLIVYLFENVYLP